jgi:hypothetical protein
LERSAGSLYTPFFASFNYFAGMAWSMWILVPLMWYCDFWNVGQYTLYKNIILTILANRRARIEALGIMPFLLGYLTKAITSITCLLW